MRRELGYDDASNSYIHFLILKITGIDFTERLVDTCTVVVFFLSLVGSVWVNVKDFKTRNND